VREDPREVGPLSGGVMSPFGSTPIRPVNGRHSLAPPSFTRRPVGVSCESLSPEGRTTGLPRSVAVPEWVGPPLFAGGAPSAPGEHGAPGPDHVPFWPERDSIFRSSCVTTFIAASRYVDPSTRSWSPTALMLAVATSARALAAILTDEDTLSRGLGTPPLPEAHSPVGYRWQNSRCCQPLRGRSTATSTTSCRTHASHVSHVSHVRHTGVSCEAWSLERPSGAHSPHSPHENLMRKTVEHGERWRRLADPVHPGYAHGPHALHVLHVLRVRHAGDLQTMVGRGPVCPSRPLKFIITIKHCREQRGAFVARQRTRARPDLSLLLAGWTADRPRSDPSGVAGARGGRRPPIRATSGTR